MKLLFYKYGSICEPDVTAAFEKLGFEIKEDTREVYNKKILPSETIKGLYEQLKNDTFSFVFSINFFPSVSDTCEIAGIPYLCLVVDSPVLELFSKAIYNKCNRIFIFDRDLYSEFYDKNPDCIFHMPLAANPAHSDAICDNADIPQQHRFAGDVSFIGSLYTEKCDYNKITLSERSRGYVDGIINSQLRIFGASIIGACINDELVSDFVSSNPSLFSFPESTETNIRDVIAQQYICVKAAETERIRTLSAVSAHFKTDIYTGSDTSCIPFINNRGYAKSQTEMPLIFRNSLINLNITARSIRSGLSQRIFDVLGSRGFLITNYQPELPELFNIGEDLEAYSSEDELLTKIEYYLSHETDRKEIADNGYNKIKKFHTYEIRLSQMLKTAFKL